MGLSHLNRFRRLGELDDLNKAIKHHSRAITLILGGHPNLPEWLDNLGEAYTERFECLDKHNDLEKAIKWKTRALALTSDSHPGLPNRLGSLAVSYNSRYDYLGELDDLEKAIGHESRALFLAPNHPKLLSRLRNLGVFYSGRFEHLGELDDLDKAIEYESRVLALIPDDHPRLPDQLDNIGVSYANRFERLGELDDLAKAIEYGSRAVSLIADGHPSLPSLLNNLAASYNDRFRHLDELGDLEKAIEYESRVVALSPGDHPQLLGWLSNLGSFYRDRFRRLGEFGDLEKAIEYKTRILALIPDGHPDLPAQLDGLAMCYGDRFEHLGVLDDLDRAIEYDSRAITLAPDGHPDLPSWFGNLGMSYSDRLRHLGELNDLEKAIECKARALALTPDGHPKLPDQLGNLAVSYSDRYRRLCELADLEKAIECDSRALALTPDGHPHTPSRLSNLGASYSDRFKHLGQLDDLEKSIECGIRSIELTPGGHPNLPPQLINLGASYDVRFRQLGQFDDLEKAIKHKTYSLSLTPDGHPDLPLGHFGLAESYFAYFQHTGNASHLQHSFDSFHKASQSLAGAPRSRFHFALRWSNLAFKHSPLNCLAAYQTTIDLLPQFIWLGATTDQRYQDLLKAESLAVDAATAAILSSDYHLALEWLEHARCVVWNQSLMLRSPLDQLQSSHPALANRLSIIATKLAEASSQSHASRAQSSNSFTLEQTAQQHRRLANEYNNLLSEARKLPGFNDFLRPMKASNLVHAARNGPIVVINCHLSRSDALIVSPGQDAISHISLPDFTQEHAQKARSEIWISLRRKGIRQRGVKIRQEPGHSDDIGSVLAILWNRIVKPVLEFLGLPHITWCPTGVVSFLPLHAAGDYDQPKSRIFDYAISSYTPTLTALLAPMSNSLNRDCRVLAIGQANTPGQSALPGTTKELARMKSHTQGKAEYTQLTGDQATVKAVLDAMEQHNWVHLACHAHQNVEDPTKSGFHLHDGTLDLASINRQSFKNKGLAFLSACQTATGDEKLPDEAIHLASGMLMAGYPSVVATMWSVHDEDAPFVADKVYEQLVQGRRIEHGEAGRALHNAVAALRDKVGEKEFGRWVPYIHIGS
ncbi:aromatic di-alanine and TPR containing protein [Rhizoctonia solani AG-3 Rhs1AP]|uniref:Aromatic di-alanine and TPR containing protein n=2 Tax=Rhizoctonia solani AG-3 TaxID=1086053 RepID=A0A074RIJ8_9AGAM|nr:aromatic di-alanine and TPR containing protein [Rhizoctonia solani AG-3 Rhs1AP]KEP46619.1 aromatic di-alanine and TPR containing protein [Rhizoctonia solani 123E]